MKPLFFLCLLSFTSVLCLAQRTAKVNSKYTYYAPENMSVEEAKHIALDRAKIQAIADEFGTVVSQSTSTVVMNENGKSNTQFFSLGGSDVKGEWIETIGEPEYKIEFEEHHIIVYCVVKGQIREVIPSKLYFESTLLRNGQKLPSHQIIFNNGDEMSLQFQASTKGYLSLFWYDVKADIIYRILPYRQDPNSLKKISANIQYVFFSKKRGDDRETEFIDEYVMTCADSTEHNAIYAVFSDKEYYTPNLLLFPTGLYGTSKSEFQSWLASIKRSSNDILIKTYEIEITN